MSVMADEPEVRQRPVKHSLYYSTQEKRNRFADSLSCVKYLCATCQGRLVVGLEGDLHAELRLPRRAVTESAGAQRDEIRAR